MVTLADVAKAVGLHVSTVSLALRHHPRIPESTRRRVEAKAREMGYRPNPLVTALMRTRRRAKAGSGLTNLAVIYPGRKVFYYPTTQVIHQSMVARAVNQGYALEALFVEDYGGEPKAILRILASRGCLGLLISDALPTNYLDKLELSGMSAVTFCFKWRRFTAVETHFEHSVRLCLEAAEQRGLWRVGLVLPSLVEEKTLGAYSGTYLHWQHFRARDRLPPLVTDCEEEIRGWLQANRPQLVITNTTLKSMLGGIPEFVLDRVSGAEGVSGVDARRDVLGAAAVDALIEQVQRGIYGEPSTSRLLLVDGEWRQ